MKIKYLLGLFAAVLIICNPLHIYAKGGKGGNSNNSNGNKYAKGGGQSNNSDDDDDNGSSNINNSGSNNNNSDDDDGGRNNNQGRQHLRIFAAEPDLDAGEMLISGINFGESEFSGKVKLFVPTKGICELEVIDFNPEPDIEKDQPIQEL